MKKLGILVVLLALMGCAQTPSSEVTALEEKVTELEFSLGELETRFPVLAQLAPGAAKADGTCQFASSCSPNQCCTWSGGSCFCDTCCYAIAEEFLVTQDGELAPRCE